MLPPDPAPFVEAVKVVHSIPEVKPDTVVIKSRHIAQPTNVQRPVQTYEPTDLYEPLPSKGLPVQRESHIAVPEPEPAGRDYRPVLLAVIGIVCGVGLLAFGIFNAGGFYETGSRLSGDLARFFYVFQIANIMEIVGILIIWTYAKKVKELLWKRKSIPTET